MNITLGSLIGDFILVAGSFLLLIILIKKFAWENITSTFEQRAKKISDDIDSAESARQKADCLLYTSDAADDLLCVDLWGRRLIKKKKRNMKKSVS